jgi:hypothetical protein
MAVGSAAKELERRFLVHGAQVHTDAGHHELRLECWELWADRAGAAGAISPPTGRLQLEMAVLAIGGTTALLPWTH